MRKIKTIKKTYILPLLAIAVVGVAFAYHASAGHAQSVQQLQGEINQLQNEIQESRKRLHELRERENTLENRLEIIQTDINKIQKELQQTRDEIATKKAEIRETERELQRKKEQMQDNAETLYKEGDPSTLEILFSSDNFSEFISRKQYLDSVKKSLDESAARVKELQEKLEDERAALEQKRKKQAGKKRELQVRRNEQQRLLEKTRGEEKRYQELVEKKKKEKARAEQELLNSLASGSLSGGSGGGSILVSSGDRVNTSDPIGYVGSTGDSSGPHLHFAVSRGSSYEEYRYVSPNEPGTRNTNLNYGLIWPVPGYNYIIDPFKPGHRGIDIIQSDDQQNVHGAEVVAAKEGEVVFSGSNQAGDAIDPRFGNVVIIDHGNGYQTFYAHLQ